MTKAFAPAALRAAAVASPGRAISPAPAPAAPPGPATSAPPGPATSAPLPLTAPSPADRGQASILLLGVVAALIAGALILAAFGQAYGARARSQRIADLSAIAAARSAPPGAATDGVLTAVHTAWSARSSPPAISPGSVVAPERTRAGCSSHVSVSCLRGRD
jgi:hypothetical protein